MSSAIILQARMGSSRLPGKVLKPIAHTTLLGWIIERLRYVDYPIIIATTDASIDDEIVDYCDAIKVKCYRGSELDVLDRYYQCALSNKINNIVRLTADNPFPDTDVLKKDMEIHISKNLDYTYSFTNMPLGTGIEIFNFDCLEISWLYGKEPHHREHVNEYILENKIKFKVLEVDVAKEKKCRELSLTIDTLEDYKKILSYKISNEDINITTEDLIKKCI